MFTFLKWENRMSTISNLKREHTATLVIVQDDSLLLLFHRKLQTWLPPGGHVEANELPHEAALREAKEETGLDVELHRQEHLSIKEPNAISIPRPYLCLLEEIPSYKDVPAHQHIDFVFLGTPKPGSEVMNLEGHEMRWFTFDEIEKLPQGTVFEEIRQIAKSLQNLRTNTMH
jgi:8-oxo-dGTP pyrophosphatase MutT (NUDIX family)